MSRPFRYVLNALAFAGLLVPKYFLDRWGYAALRQSGFYVDPFSFDLASLTLFLIAWTLLVCWIRDAGPKKQPAANAERPAPLQQEERRSFPLTW